MPIVRPIVRAISRAIVSSITGDDVVQRYIWDFAAAASQHGVFSSSVVFDADFKYQSTSSGGAGTTSYIVGNASTSDNYIRIDSGDASIGFRAAGGTAHTINLDSSLDRTKLNIISVNRSGTTVSVDINGVTQTATVTEAGTFTVDVTNRSNVSYFDGTYQDILFEKAGVVIGDFPLDTDLSNSVIANRAAVLGPVLGNLNPQSGITVNVDTVSGTKTAFNFMTVNNSYVTAGESYLVTFNNAAFTGDIRIRDGVGELVGNTTGNTQVIVKPTDTTLIFSAGTTDFNGSVDITVQLIPSITPYLTMQNMTTLDAEPLRRFDGSFSPNRWVNVNNDADFIEVAGT